MYSMVLLLDKKIAQSILIFPGMFYTAAGELFDLWCLFYRLLSPKLRKSVKQASSYRLSWCDPLK